MNQQRGTRKKFHRDKRTLRVSQSVQPVVPSIPRNKQRAPLCLYPTERSCRTRARICRWLTERLAVYQENRQVERERNEERGLSEQTRKEGEMGAREDEGRNEETKRKRERKKDGGVGTSDSSTWSLLRVSRSVVLSVAFERFRTGCPSSLFDVSSAAPSVKRKKIDQNHRECDPFVVTVTHTRHRQRNRRSKAGLAMAFVPKILLTCAFFILPTAIASIEHTANDHRDFTNHRLTWPVWPYHEKFTRSRHEHDDRSFQQQGTVNNWIRNDLFERSSSTIAPLQTTASGVRHRVEQHVYEQRTSKPEKFSAVAVADYTGTRAIAYAGYHNNHRHQPREVVTQGYQHHTTTPATYTRHHPG